MTANLSFPTVPTARQIGLPWGGKDTTLYPASLNHRHPGYDLLAPNKSPIYAIASGTVEWAGYEQAHGYGRHVYIAHEINGVKFHTGYAHLRSLNVAAGDSITNGQQIGIQGGDLWDNLRGASRGTHLHFEVVLPEKPERDYIKTYRGYSVDPLAWLADTFLAPPAYIGKITTPKGVRLRLFPEVSTRATRVGALAYNQERGFAEKSTDAFGNTWLRLNTLRTIWAAATYNGETLIEYVPYNLPEADPAQVSINANSAMVQRMVTELVNTRLQTAIRALQGELDQLKAES